MYGSIRSGLRCREEKNMKGHIKLFTLSLDIEKMQRFKTVQAVDTCDPSWSLAAMPLTECELQHDYKV
jgi:hypothetical protein